MTADALQFDRLDTMLAEGRLIRGKWTDTDAAGRELACWMASLYPPCGVAKNATVCPASLMPGWLALLIPWMDDAGTDERWLEHTQRFARVIRLVVTLDAVAMDTLSRRIRVLIVREAMSHIRRDEWGCQAACEQTVEALESGDVDKISAARSAAWSAARSAAWSAARSAARSAASAARSAASAARIAAESAASAAWSAASAAEDRLIDGMLTAMEEAVRDAAPKETPR